jgi:hypothetical protein
VSKTNSFIIIFLYVIVGLIGFEGWFNYNFDSPENWYARSGALLTLIGLYSELNVLPKAKELAVKYGSSSSKFVLKNTTFLTHFSVIHGTLVWSYGDIYYLWLKTSYTFSLTELFL